MSRDQELTCAVSNSLRLRLLLALQQEPASPAELAAEFDVPLARVSYHLRVLAIFGVISPPPDDPDGECALVSDERVQVLLHAAREGK